MKIVDINGNTRDCLSIKPDDKWPGYIKVEFAKHVEWYPKKDFVKNNPQLVNIVKGTPDGWKEDLGRVSLASNQTLTDKTKKWQSNEFAGYPLWISRGIGEGQTRSIIMNSNDTLIINKPWKTIPDKSSQYVISHNVHDPQIMGNTLPVEYKVKNSRLKKKK